jgi:hypothetical protein
MATWTRTSGTKSNSLSAQGLIGLLGIFAGLCTVFALIVSMTDGWREHARESWPQATATIERCSLDPYVPLESASPRQSGTSVAESVTARTLIKSRPGFVREAPPQVGAGTPNG